MNNQNSFAQHIFISYAHIDNQPLTNEHEGWITRFHDTLDTFLSQRLGEKAKIWRDDKLHGNDVFAHEIANRFHGAALLIPVVSPRFLNSEWCTKEVREFCLHAELSGGLVVGNKSRVLKVVKIPPDSEHSLPPVVQEILGYEFFVYENEVPLELDPHYGDRFKQDYLRKVCVLANDAARLIRDLSSSHQVGSASTTSLPALTGMNDGNASVPTGTEQNPPQILVYLAECSNDLRQIREMLAADLKQHGYGVLPDQRLPIEDEDACREAVGSQLEKCKLAIHLIGATYGAVPDGPSQRSIGELQNEWAARRCENTDLRRLIWLPDHLQPTQARQQAFIETLLNDSKPQRGADLIAGNLEELKSAIHTTLASLSCSGGMETDVLNLSGSEALMVYVVAVEKDRKATLPLRKWLKRMGFEVRMPAFEGNAAAVRQANQQILMDCDAVIIYYGSGDDAWKHSITIDVRKKAAYRESRPLLAKFIYLADPRTNDKEDMIDMEESHLIDGLEGFDEMAMAPFLAAIERGSLQS